MKKTILIFLFTLLPLLLSALECVECGKRIRGQYLKNQEGEVFCSKDCADSRLPRCYRCKKTCVRSVIFQQRTFCSQQCLHAVFKCGICRKGLDSAVEVKNSAGKTILICPDCQNKPRCYFCCLPTGGKIMSDGRTICRNCRKTAVTDEAEVKKIFLKVRKDLAEMFGYDNKHPIELILVNAKELEKKSEKIYSPGGGRRLALMSYNRTVKTVKLPDGNVENKVVAEKCQIYILDTMPRDRLYDTFAHELTHDYLRHYMNGEKGKELDREEGFCELVASLYNIKRGKKELNMEKETNQDPVYGGGYRKMRSYYRVNKSFKQTLKQVR